MITSDISLFISNYAFLFAVIVIFLYLAYLFLTWYFKNQKKIYKFRDKMFKKKDKEVIKDVQIEKK